jgi:ABC-type uncharacterized transport system auxiliary subunit
MKKLFAILTLAGALTACNNGDSDKAATTDSPKMDKPVMDTVKKMMDSTANKMMDTTKKMMDTKMDKMKADTTKKTK